MQNETKVISDRAIGEITRRIDAKKYKTNYITYKFREKGQLVDTKARVVFGSALILSYIKCASRLNHYKVISKAINEKGISN